MKYQIMKVNRHAANYITEGELPEPQKGWVKCESEVFVMLIILDGEGTARNISKNA